MSSISKQGNFPGIESFTLPRYDQLPDDGIYLEQAATYITRVLSPITDSGLTGSMISNYVKKDLIANPVKKRYYREQIAYLIFIAVVKSVLSMDDIRLIIGMQRNSYPSQRAYDYFCSELENVLKFVFGYKSTLDVIGVDDTPQKDILRSAIITVAYKVYLDYHCAALQAEE